VNGTADPHETRGELVKVFLPTRMAPASSMRRTTVALFSGRWAKAGQPAVVGSPLTSMLSLTDNGTP